MESEEINGEAYEVKIKQLEDKFRPVFSTGNSPHTFNKSSGSFIAVNSQIVGLDVNHHPVRQLFEDLHVAFGFYSTI